MAKFKFPDSNSSGFSGEVELSITDGKSKATMEFADGGEIRFFGEGFKANAEGGLKAGFIDKMVWENAGGGTAVVVEGRYKAAEVAMTPGGEAIFYSLFDGKDTVTGSNDDDYLTLGGKGNDQIFGKGGADTINGGRGSDILSGGADADTFQFTVEDGVGQDTITDFDTTGGNADEFAFGGLTIEKVVKAGGGDDCKLVLDNEATILLEGVTKAEFQDYWASLP
jgi:Ca2+-binding RTX toxin-like protein